MYIPSITPASQIMPESFQYDVFLSHSSKDKAIVRPLAERLRKDGIRVFFDEWEIRPGDSIPAKLEQGLEQSRVLLLCMSANAFGSDWAQLESGTFRFRDPLNKDRRFIPLRLDEGPIKGSLAQFLYVDWMLDVREQEYPKLVESCRRSTNTVIAEKDADCRPRIERPTQLNCEAKIWSYAFTPSGTRILIGTEASTVLLFDLETRESVRELTGHSRPVYSVDLSADDEHALSGGADQTVRLWELKTGVCLRILKGHKGFVNSVAYSNDQTRALSGSSDRTVKLWDLQTGQFRTLEGHTSDVLSVAWSPDGQVAVSGSRDKTVRVWDTKTALCLRTPLMVIRTT